MGESGSGDVYYDPYDVGIVADPYPTYRRLRDEAPLYYNATHDSYASSRHYDAEKALEMFAMQVDVANVVMA